MNRKYDENTHILGMFNVAWGVLLALTTRPRVDARRHTSVPNRVRPCVCGCPPGSHQHYRDGTDCAICAACAAYRPARRARLRK